MWCFGSVSLEQKQDDQCLVLIKCAVFSRFFWYSVLYLDTLVALWWTGPTRFNDAEDSCAVEHITSTTGHHFTLGLLAVPQTTSIHNCAPQSQSLTRIPIQSCKGEDFAHHVNKKTAWTKESRIDGDARLHFLMYSPPFMRRFQKMQ